MGRPKGLKMTDAEKEAFRIKRENNKAEKNLKVENVFVEITSLTNSINKVINQKIHKLQPDQIVILKAGLLSTLHSIDETIKLNFDKEIERLKNELEIIEKKKALLK